MMFTYKPNLSECFILVFNTNLHGHNWLNSVTNLPRLKIPTLKLFLYFSTVIVQTFENKYREYFQNTSQIGLSR